MDMPALGGWEEESSLLRVNVLFAPARGPPARQVSFSTLEVCLTAVEAYWPAEELVLGPLPSRVGASPDPA
jgi:hypothetical protein